MQKSRRMRYRSAVSDIREIDVRRAKTNEENRTVVLYVLIADLQTSTGDEILLNDDYWKTKPI
jgi:sulfopyruvate decarboxylase TPP-binding subunit